MIPAFAFVRMKVGGLAKNTRIIRLARVLMNTALGNMRMIR